MHLIAEANFKTNRFSSHRGGRYIELLVKLMFWKLKVYVVSSKDWTKETSSKGYQIYRAASCSGSPWTENSWRVEEYWGKYRMLALFWLSPRHPIKASTGGRIQGYMNPWSALIEPCLCSSLFAKEIRVPGENNGTLVCKIVSNKM